MFQCSKKEQHNYRIFWHSCVFVSPNDILIDLKCLQRTSAKHLFGEGRGVIVMAIMTSQGRKYESLLCYVSPAHDIAEAPVKSGFHEAFIRAILDQKVIVTLVGLKGSLVTKIQVIL